MMNSFSSDVDILRYEPILFGELRFAGQELISGEGAVISDSRLIDAEADFNNAKINAGMVINLRSEDGAIDGCFEIVNVESQTSLAVSVMRPVAQAEIIGLKDAENVDYRICTYQSQGNEMLTQVTQHFGLRPGTADGAYCVDDILDVSVLKQLSVYGVLSCVYATLSGRADDKENYWNKSKYYRRLYEKALQRCRVSIDLGDDGVADFSCGGGSVRLLRD